MPEAAPLGVLDRQPDNFWRALLAVAVATLVATAIVYPLRAAVPGEGQALVYLPGIVIISIRWGLRWSLVAIALAVVVFDVTHLQPYGELGTKGRHGAALIVFAIVAALTSLIAQRSRLRAISSDRRRRDADLLADLAQGLYEAEDDDSATEVVRSGLQRALGEPGLTLLGPGERAAGSDLAVPLWHGEEVVATLALPNAVGADRTGELMRLAPALGSLLAAVRRRLQLQAEAVEAEALRRSEATKTTILHSVSHDLRSPLAALRAAAQGLGSGQMEPDQERELIELVGQVSEDLIETVENLLTVARIDAGAANPQLQWTDAAEVIAAAIARHDQLAVESRVGELPLIHADAVQLERILDNLLANAARHGRGEEVRVEAEVSDEILVIAVSDSGPGLGGRDPERIFEPFASSDKQHGIGLGLAVVRGFTEAIGGVVTAGDVPGGGARFELRLPIPATERAGAGSPPAEEVEPS